MTTSTHKESPAPTRGTSGFIYTLDLDTLDSPHIYTHRNKHFMNTLPVNLSSSDPSPPVCSHPGGTSGLPMTSTCLTSLGQPDSACLSALSKEGKEPRRLGHRTESHVK